MNILHYQWNDNNKPTNNLQLPSIYNMSVYRTQSSTAVMTVVLHHIVILKLVFMFSFS